MWKYLDHVVIPIHYVLSGAELTGSGNKEWWWINGKGPRTYMYKKSRAIASYTKASEVMPKLLKITNTQWGIQNDFLQH